MRPLRNVLRRAGAILATCGRTLAANTEELAVLAGLLLIAIGFWNLWRPGSFLAPGIVVLWLYIPQRRAFIEPQTVSQPRRRKDS